MHGWSLFIFLFAKCKDLHENCIKIKDKIGVYYFTLIIIHYSQFVYKSPTCLPNISCLFWTFGETKWSSDFTHRRSTVACWISAIKMEHFLAYWFKLSPLDIFWTSDFGIQIFYNYWLLIGFQFSDFVNFYKLLLFKNL